jgi:hypothetical protein
VDEGRYIEGAEPAGTINILVLSNVRLTDAALARALITVTEGKTAALEDLQVKSTYTPACRPPARAPTASSWFRAPVRPPPATPAATAASAS